MTERNSNLPVILGGRPTVTENQEHAARWPLLDSDDESAVLDVMRAGNLSTAGVLRELENDYSALTGRRHALAHCNGTSALLAAFWAIGLEPGDEVLVQSATFWASVSPMLWLGAVPVFCESEGERMGPCPLDMERRITPRTRAMVITHLWGLPARMTQLLDLAKRHGLRVIEDASHAHGATWRGQACGSLGDVSVMSLQGDKLAPAGEGGMFLCDEDDLLERAVCLGDITRIAQLDTPARRFAATGFGMKTRMAPLSAAVGRVQLAKLDEHNQSRHRCIVYLSEALQGMGFETFLPPAHIERVYFEFLVRCPPGRLAMDAPDLCTALAQEGCLVSAPRYPLLHQQPFFTENHFQQVARLGPQHSVPDYQPDSLPFTQKINGQLLKLPAFHAASDELLEQYVAAFQKVLLHAEQITECIAKRTSGATS